MSHERSIHCQISLKRVSSFFSPPSLKGTWGVSTKKSSRLCGGVWVLGWHPSIWNISCSQETELRHDYLSTRECPCICGRRGAGILPWCVGSRHICRRSPCHHHRRTDLLWRKWWPITDYGPEVNGWNSPNQEKKKRKTRKLFFLYKSSFVVPIVDNGSVTGSLLL